MFISELPFWREWVSIGGAKELTHIDSDLCWCDPMVEVDESEREIVIHREVTWN